MSTTNQRIIDIGASQHDLVTRPLLLDEGISDRMIYRRRRSGFLVDVHDGVYAVLRQPTSALARAHAAELALPGSAAYRETAAAIKALPGDWVDQVQLAVRRGGTHDLDGVFVHETLHLPAADLELIDGVVVTTTARTVCDLAAVLSWSRLKWLTQRLVSLERLTPDDLVACASAFRRRGRLGSAKLDRLLADVHDGEIVPATTLERHFVELERRYDLPLFQRQVQPPWYDGIRGVVDFCRHRERLIVETDGRPWHMIEQDTDEDRRRERVARRHHYLVLRFGDAEVLRRPDEVVEEIRWNLADREPVTVAA